MKFLFLHWLCCKSLKESIRVPGEELLVSHHQAETLNLCSPCPLSLNLSSLQLPQTFFFFGDGAEALCSALSSLPWQNSEQKKFSGLLERERKAELKMSIVLWTKYMSSSKVKPVKVSFVCPQNPLKVDFYKF